MTLLLIGLALFLLIHMVPSITPLRQGLVMKLGSNAYQGLFSLLALTGLILIVYGKVTAPEVNVWSPPEWTRVISHALMPIAFVLFFAAYIPSNIKRFTRHPLLWGTFLWALMHLISNGDLSSILLFGGLAFFAISKILLIGSRQTPNLGQALSVRRDLILLMAALIDYGLFLYLHEWVSGVALL